MWSLFTDSVMAKKLMTEDYQLVDLQAMTDDEIVKKKHLGMLEYMMKHIHMRDMIKLWEKFLIEFKHIIILDKEKGYIYLRSFLWYTDAKLSKQKQPELVEVFHLSSKDKDSIMKTIAEKYMGEGLIRGRQEGIKIGEAKGEHNKAVIIAKNALSRIQNSYDC
ncbi:transposase, YhgA-like family protein [Rickettsia endosymbiont of Ixodes pacificus]|nr:transposase, YhgA-like family protein [Rickettsia endosymbiont of Ixodes pacificus]